MIKLKYVDGFILVYDVNDWSTLRKAHRIVGQTIGNTIHLPSLPSKLLPEEALLLIEKNLAELHENDDSSSQNTVFSADFEEAFFQAQQRQYKEIRKVQLLALIDQIVDKKRKLGDERSKEEIFNEELERSSIVTKENMIWPILLTEPNQKTVLLSKEVIFPLTTPLKTAVFRDLWERGYYITGGQKFGGDFLVYCGDPIVYHAVFIVKCIELERTFTPTELVAFGRLGVSVKKRAVLGSIKDGEVNYMTINWIDA